MFMWVSLSLLQTIYHFFLLRLCDEVINVLFSPILRMTLDLRTSYYLDSVEYSSLLEYA